MNARTNNKIALCQNCFGTLTPAQDGFCNAMCLQAYTERLEKMGPRKTIWVYCNKNMIDLAIGNHAAPIRTSMFLWSGHELVCAAAFDQEKLEAIGDKETNAYDAWWREIGRLNVSIEPHQSRVMREEGMLSYLCDRFGISTEKNVACAIGELTIAEGHKTPLDLFNSL